MEQTVFGSAEHSGKLTRKHLKEVILFASMLIEGGHKISDVRFEIPKDKPTAIVLVYDVLENLVIEYQGRSNEIEPDSLTTDGP